jgi:hypothetical protein
MTTLPERSETPAQPALGNIYRENIGNWLLGFGAVAFIFFIYSASYIFLYQKEHPTRCMAIGAFWVLGVPIYFFLEHLFIFRWLGNADQYNQFTRVQDLAAKIWAAVIVVLAACYFKQFPSGH